MSVVVISKTLQRFSIRMTTGVRHALLRAGGWLRGHPQLAAWFMAPAESEPEESYRAYNGRLFASFREQERMLADRPRMEFYAAAIARHVRPGDRVIDLGTGTGILAALASRRGAAQVHAIDHSEIIDHARTLAAANHLERVEFHRVHSTEFCTDPVDVILHEQIGDALFDEHMMANVADLRDRLLKPGGRIVPSQFEFYCEPIQLNDARVAPFLWELKVHGYDYSSLAQVRPDEPGYYDLVSTDPTLVARFLGEPEPLLRVDLQTQSEADLPREVSFARTIVQPGRLDGYAVFFRARVDDDLILTSSPLDPGRAPHWGYRILRTEQEWLERGERLEVRLKVGQWPDIDTWRWTHTRRAAPR